MVVFVVCTNKIHVVIRETCAFDSILQVVMYAFALYCAYKTAMMTADNSILTLAQDIIQSGKLCAKHYILRGQILCATPIFQTMTYTRQISTLNVNCNATHLAEYLFQTTPSSTRTKICKECNKSIIRKLPLVSINVNVILQNDLCCIQQSIEKAVFTHGTCHTCKANTIESVEYGPHILIDTSILTDDAYLHAINVKKKDILIGRCTEYYQH